MQSIIALSCPIGRRHPCFLPGESQGEQLDVFIKEGYLTYFDRHERNPFDVEKSQHASYQHCIYNFGKDTTWQLAINIDEYPFSPEDICGAHVPVLLCEEIQ